MDIDPNLHRPDSKPLNTTDTGEDVPLDSTAPSDDGEDQAEETDENEQSSDESQSSAPLPAQDGEDQAETDENGQSSTDSNSSAPLPAHMHRRPGAKSGLSLKSGQQQAVNPRKRARSEQLSLEKEKNGRRGRSKVGRRQLDKSMIRPLASDTSAKNHDVDGDIATSSNTPNEHQHLTSPAHSNNQLRIQYLAMVLYNGGVSSHQVTADGNINTPSVPLRKYRRISPPYRAAARRPEEDDIPTQTDEHVVDASTGRMSRSSVTGARSYMEWMRSLKTKGRQN